MPETLAPAPRRLFLGVAVAVALALVAVLAAVFLGGEPDVQPVDQGRAGPVLLVPGYGGNTASLEVLAATLRAHGREAEIVPAPGDGRGNLRGHAMLLAAAAARSIAGGAPSVDVVGFSAGGIVARIWVSELGGDGQARRIVTVGSPHHGTDLTHGTARPCPIGCRQLMAGSDLLDGLNRGDETPRGPRWISLWTEDDRTVVPPTSARLEGALAFSVQSVCPGLHVSHSGLPRAPEVAAIVEHELAAPDPDLPGPGVCTTS
ncbi:lipase [Nocardioides guangzhouensis]|uniref:Lipase n=1 Tax=Nocardioides guangzhouensis TaxID=2497878 RepID=A0A4Q4Z6J6_9ACTN|nr:lipase [Nocardioides guangzhouensis]RYP82574.1 lipase [Nocardioides guangzhouensis]